MSEIAREAPDRLTLLSAALAETAARASRFWRGVERYHNHPYRRPQTIAPTLWSSGATRLLDYAPGLKGQTVLAIPSLVNGAEVLDLQPERSLMTALGDAGFRPFLLDWGTPEPDAAKWTIDRYVEEKLLPAIEAVEAHAGVGARAHVVGAHGCFGALRVQGDRADARAPILSKGSTNARCHPSRTWGSPDLPLGKPDNVTVIASGKSASVFS